MNYPPLKIRGVRGVMKFIRNDPTLKQRRRELRCNQTEAEKTFWAQIRNRRFYGMRFVRQYSAGPYILDFYCPQLRLVVELDGGQHTEDNARHYDATRSEYLKAQDISVMRFWNHEVLRDIESVLSKMAEKVTPPSPSYLKRGKEGFKNKRNNNPVSGNSR
jgi:very-short-patch-repair endonuclease